MTTDEAATLLATYELTGSVSETARRLGRNKGSVSRDLRKAGVTTPEATLQRIKRTPWVEAYALRENKLLDIVDAQMDSFRPRELIGAVKIIGDARYREEHPESVRGVVIDQSQHIHVDTAQALAALRAAKTELLTDGNATQDHRP